MPEPHVRVPSLLPLFSLSSPTVACVGTPLSVSTVCVAVWCRCDVAKFVRQLMTIRDVTMRYQSAKAGDDALVEMGSLMASDILLIADSSFSFTSALLANRTVLGHCRVPHRVPHPRTPHTACEGGLHSAHSAAVPRCEWHRCLPPPAAPVASCRTGAACHVATARQARTQPSSPPRSSPLSKACRGRRRRGAPTSRASSPHSPLRRPSPKRPWLVLRPSPNRPSPNRPSLNRPSPNRPSLNHPSPGCLWWLRHPSRVGRSIVGGTPSSVGVLSHAGAQLKVSIP